MDIQLFALAVGASLSVLLTVLAISRLALAQDILVQSRLSALGREAELGPSVTAAMLRSSRRDPLALVDQALRRHLGAGPRRQLDRAGVRLSLGDFFLVRAILVAVWALIATLAGWSSGVAMPLPLLAGGGAVLGLLAPAVFLRVRIARRAQQTERQLVELCEVMSTMLGSGFGYMQALGAAAEQVGRPLGEEISRLLDAVRLGGDFDHELAAARERLDSADFEVIATALEVQRRTGGNLSEILRGVGQTIRERQAFHQELHALTSRERFSAVIIAVFPLLLAGMLTVALPEVFGRLFTEPVGRIVLVAALGMDLVGYLVARRLAKLEL